MHTVFGIKNVTSLQQMVIDVCQQPMLKTFTGNAAEHVGNVA